MATKKVKAGPAPLNVPQTKDACAQDIRTLGDLQRALARQLADMNDEIAAVTARYQPEIDSLAEKAQRLTSGIQYWCEANRALLTDGLKVKSANLITGEVAWRTNPPSLSITGAEAVIKTMETLQLPFVRTKKEVDKEGILACLSAARTITAEEAKLDAAKGKLLDQAELLQGLKGVKLTRDVEVFSVTPFEQEAA